MQQPKISIIIPVYNAEKTLNKCLDALVSQTYKNIEIICVNDGSKDNSLKILDEYSQKDSRFVIINQENSGPAKARHDAIEKSTGEYLMFCDADDWYEPEMAEQMVTTIEEQDVDIVMCDCNVIDLSNGTIHNQSDINWCYLKHKGYYNLNSKIKDEINTVLWNKIFRKSIIDKYNIQYPIKYEHDDSMFYWKYILVSENFFALNKKLYNYVVGNPCSISGLYRIHKETQHMFDFIFSWQDVFEFIKKRNILYDANFLINHSFGTLKFFYSMLPDFAKKNAYEQIKTFVEKNYDLLKEHVNYSYILKIKSFREFNNFMLGQNLNYTFLEKIFSVKNSSDQKHKVICILGIKIKIKRNR